MEKIKYEINRNIARITMDDGKVNAMNPEFFSGIENAIDRCIEDNASVLIISGREGFFSGGLDLKLMSKIAQDDLPLQQKNLQSLIEKPMPSQRRECVKKILKKQDFSWNLK